jgi:hypothetical protein
MSTMTVQISLRLDDEIVDLARKAAERQNRSLANYVENLLSEMLLTPAATDAPVLSVVDADADLDRMVAIDRRGKVDRRQTRRLHALLAVADKRRK